MATNYFITGGAGFIGANYVNRLLERGGKVTIYDNLSRAGSKRNLTWLQDKFGQDGFQLVIGDVRDAPLVKASSQNADIILHLAAQVAVTTSVVDPREDFEVNAGGTFNLLEAARLNSRSPVFLYASTNKVYGGMENVRVVEDATRWRYANLPQGCPETQPLDFHSPYGCCYSVDTDILTRDGWKKIFILKKNDEVLTYNLDTKLAEFQKPTAHFMYPYTGKMYVQNNRRLRTCVTPNHKMLVSWDCNHNELEHPRLMAAEDIKGKTMAYLLAADLNNGKIEDYFTLPPVKAGKHKHDFPDKKIFMDDWLRFLGWYLSEGHCYEAKKTGNCTITLTTYYRKEEAINVMRAIGLAPVVDNHHIVATSRQLFEYLKKFGKARDKYIPKDVKRLCTKQLRILLQSLLDGDGDKNGKNSWRYTTISPRLADDVQEIAIKCGLAASVALDKQGYYRVYICTTRTTQCNQGKDRSEWKEYSGNIYCVEVPNSIVMVRQNGHAYFSGNSKGAGDQYVRDYARIYDLPTVVLRQSCIYGPRQFGVEDQGWLAWMIIAAVTGRQLTIYGDGKQIRDVLHVDDLLDAYDNVITRIGQVKGQIYNLGGGPENTLSIWTEFGPLLEELLGKPIPVDRRDWRPGDQKVFVADIRKAEADLGWKPKVSVRDGVEQLFKWVLENKECF